MWNWQRQVGLLCVYLLTIVTYLLRNLKLQYSPLFFLKQPETSELGYHLYFLLATKNAPQTPF